jgi:hypothetical protein
MQLQFNMKGHFTTAFFVPVIPFAIAPPFATNLGPLKVCNTPWYVVLIHEIIQQEDILSVCFELWLENKNSTVTKIGNMEVYADPGDHAV